MASKGYKRKAKMIFYLFVAIGGLTLAVVFASLLVVIGAFLLFGVMALGVVSFLAAVIIRILRS